MKNIAFIPLDNRPVCYDLPIDVINCTTDYQIFLPPISDIGGLYDVANFDKIISWLNELNNIDYIIVALDTIAYGSLVASRRIELTFEEILERLNKFKNIIIKKQAKVLAFSSIMRISNNNINEEEKEYWCRYGKKIFDYSFNFHKSEICADADANAKFSCISNVIPKEILDDYLNTRERNFNINKTYLKWLKEGILDTLVFSKDDCAQFGLNVKEANELEKIITQNNLNGVVKTGADEIPLSLLSRVITEKQNIKIYPIWTNETGKNLISKYEDITIEKSVLGQIELAGASICDDINNADLILYINNFENTQGELVMNVDTKPFNAELQKFNKPYFYVDVRFANGADNAFVKKILETKFDNNFYGFSAWNTSANSLGCGILIALVKFCSKNFNNNNFKKLQFIRFIDDWAYQANIRGKIRNNSNNLSSKILKKELNFFESTICKWLGTNQYESEYSFPWNRFFEIRITIQNT